MLIRSSSTSCRTEKPDFVEISYSIMTSHPESRLLPTAMDLGIGVIAMQPFQDGAYFRQVSGRELPGWASEFCDSWAQFCLKYIVSHPAVTVAISETNNLEHARDNLGAGIGRLPDEATRNRMQGCTRLYRVLVRGCGLLGSFAVNRAQPAMDPSHARPRGRVAALLSVFAKHLGANVIRVDAEDLPPSIAPLVETKTG